MWFLAALPAGKAFDGTVCAHCCHAASGVKSVSGSHVVLTVWGAAKQEGDGHV